MRRWVAYVPEEALFVGFDVDGLTPVLANNPRCALWFVSTWPSERAAVQDLILDRKLANRFRYAAVDVVSETGYAAVPELRKAGLGDYVEPLQRNFLVHCPKEDMPRA